MGTLKLMGLPGDTRHTWNPDNADETNTIRKMFDDLVKGKKFRAFRVNPEDGSKGEPIKEFDPKASKIIIAAPMAGGSPLRLERPEEEVDRVLNWAAVAVEAGNRSSGTYEEGVQAALLWVTGQNDEAPDEDLAA